MSALNGDTRTYRFGPKGNPFHLVRYQGETRFLAGLSPSDAFAQEAQRALRQTDQGMAKLISEHIQKAVEGPTLLEQVLIP